jgi:hypothetical protein
MAVSHPKDWRRGTMQWAIAEALVRHDLNRKRAFAIDVRPSVGSEPLIFRGKLSGGYGVLPHEDQCRRAWYRTGDVLTAILKHGWNPDDAPAEDAPAAPAEDAPEDVKPEDDSTADLIPQDLKPEPAAVVPIRPIPAGVALQAERFYSEVQKRRAFVRGRKDMESLDSMRIVIDGVKALIQGLPVEALCLRSKLPGRPRLARMAASYRPAREDLKPKLPEGTYDYAGFAPRPSAFAHATSEYVARLVQAGVPVWLHGPAGSGKSSAARYAAEKADLKYYEVNLAGAMVSAVKGKDRLKEFVESDFMRAYEHGGLCCLEEFDSAHPTVGTALNTALAGPGYFNDADGRYVKRDPNFRCVVTANSLGYGSPEFKRQDLDAATKDRFRMGRVYVGLDLDLERAIFNSLLEAPAAIAA